MSFRGAEAAFFAAVLRADVPDFFAAALEVRAVVPDFLAAVPLAFAVAAFFAAAAEPLAAFFAVVPLAFAADAFFAVVPEVFAAVLAFFAPVLRAAEDAEVRPAPLPPLPPDFRGCTSISKFASSRTLRSPLMNPKHSMFPV